MKAKIQDKHKCGIYLIKNLINDKVYIGKSINIYQRIQKHISNLRSKNLKGENTHFINSWHKYGEDSFDYIILEECKREFLKDKELYYILKYNSLDRAKGYNFRLDSESGMIPLESTRKKYSEACHKRFSKQEERDKVSIFFTKFWKENPEKKVEMSLNLKKSKQEKYRFFKMDEEENILEIFNSVEEIINKYPNYKWQNIYSVCNGYKKRIYGFKWKKELKI